VARTGVLQGGLPIHVLRPGRDFDAHRAIVVGGVSIVNDRRWYVNVDAAGGVDHLVESFKVQA
jgi:hypothetical protein